MHRYVSIVIIRNSTQEAAKMTLCEMVSFEIIIKDLTLLKQKISNDKSFIEYRKLYKSTS